MLAGKFGFFASGTHAEATDWASRVTAAGGTYSASTLAAVSQFCKDIDAAGIRNRFYRLNLLCGNNLTAALVPLYRNTSFAGSVLGNTTDTNTNFVSGDYTETGGSAGGLKGNGSTKSLNTGVNPATIGADKSDFHLSLYAKGVSATGTSRLYIGNNVYIGSNVNAQETFIGIYNVGTVEGANLCGAQADRRAAPAGTKEGLLIITTAGSRAMTYYLNGTASATTNASGSAFASAAVTVFNVGPFYALAQYVRAYSVGLGLNATQEASYRSALVTFNTSLARNV